MNTKKYFKSAMCIMISIIVISTSVISGQIGMREIKAEDLDTHVDDGVPGILEVDDFDTREDYQKYLRSIHTYKNYRYKINLVKGVQRITIKKYIGAEKTVRIPSVILGVRVITVSKGSFKNCKSVKKIIIPEGINTIDKGAFTGCRAKIKKPSYLKKQKKGSYIAIAQVKIPRKGKDKKVNYKASKVTKITTSKKNMKLKKGKKKKIYTRIYVSKKKKQGYLDYSILKFSSSNKKVVKVSKYGNIRAIKKGKATITVKLKTSGKSYKIKVKVTK